MVLGKAAQCLVSNYEVHGFTRYWSQPRRVPVLLFIYSCTNCRKLVLTHFDRRSCPFCRKTLNLISRFGQQYFDIENED